MNAQDCHKGAQRGEPQPKGLNAKTQRRKDAKIRQIDFKFACIPLASLRLCVFALKLLPNAARKRAQSRKSLALALVLILALGVSCRTAPPIAPVDFSAPGWRVLQGQAVWKPDTHRPELAGELLVATNSTGDFFVQFSKIPFPMAVAQSVNKNWRIEFGHGEYVRAGVGLPPGRFAWFELPRILAGAPAGAQWRFEREADNHWKLENRRTGESLEGFLWP